MKKNLILGLLFLASCGDIVSLNGTNSQYLVTYDDVKACSRSKIMPKQMKGGKTYRLARQQDKLNGLMYYYGARFMNQGLEGEIVSSLSKQSSTDRAKKLYGSDSRTLAVIPGRVEEIANSSLDEGKRLCTEKDFLILIRKDEFVWYTQVSGAEMECGKTTEIVLKRFAAIMKTGIN